MRGSRTYFDLRLYSFLKYTKDQINLFIKLCTNNYNKHAHALNLRYTMMSPMKKYLKLIFVSLFLLVISFLIKENDSDISGSVVQIAEADTPMGDGSCASTDGAGSSGDGSCGCDGGC